MREKGRGERPRRDRFSDRRSRPPGPRSPGIPGFRPGGPQAAERSSVGGGDKGPGPPDLPSPSRAVRGHRRTGPHPEGGPDSPREDRNSSTSSWWTRWRRRCGRRRGRPTPGDAGAAVVPSSQGVEALYLGEIDLAWRVICDETAHLSDEGRSGAAEIVEEAPNLTTVQLGPAAPPGDREEPLKLPSVATRGCGGVPGGDGSDPDGTAELWGRQLPADRVAAAWHRITAMARACAGWATRGTSARSADILLDLLDGGRITGQEQEAGSG